MKSINTVVAIVAIAGGAASGNLVVNGSFEDNTETSTAFNLSDAQFTAAVANATAFGGRDELDLVSTDVTWGLDPQSGDWKVSLNSPGAGTESDAFSLDLSSALVIGQAYTLSFWAANNFNSASSEGDVRIGTSSSATAFGTQIAVTSALTDTEWTNFTLDFTATSADSFLTVEAFGGYVEVDNFSLTVVPTPSTAGVLALAGIAAIRRRR